MTQKLIKTSDEFDKTVERAGELMSAEPESHKADELEVLGLLID